MGSFRRLSIILVAAAALVAWTGVPTSANTGGGNNDSGICEGNHNGKHKDGNHNGGKTSKHKDGKKHGKHYSHKFRMRLRCVARNGNLGDYSGWTWAEAKVNHKRKSCHIKASSHTRNDCRHKVKYAKLKRHCFQFPPYFPDNIQCDYEVEPDGDAELDADA